MPKKIGESFFTSPQINFPKKVPGGLKAICPGCKTFYITEAEEELKPTIGGSKKFRREIGFLIGWSYRCPICKHKIFFPWNKLTWKKVGLINNWEKEECLKN